MNYKHEFSPIYVNAGNSVLDLISKYVDSGYFVDAQNQYTG